MLNPHYCPLCGRLELKSTTDLHIYLCEYCDVVVVIEDFPIVNRPRSHGGY